MTASGGSPFRSALSREADEILGSAAGADGDRRDLGVDGARALLLSQLSVESAPVAGPGWSGPPEVFCRPVAGRALVLAFHGGGLVVGHPRALAALAAELSAAADVDVVVPGYGLAPEHGMRDRIERLTRTVAEIAAKRPDAPLVLLGNSAGALLAIRVAASLSLARVRVSGVALLAPMLDPSLDTASVAAWGEGHLLTATDLRWFWDLAGRDVPPIPELVAALPPDVPVLVGLPQRDPLYDDGQALALELMTRSRPVTAFSLPGAIHAQSNGRPPQARRVLTDIVTDWLRRVPSRPSRERKAPPQR